MNWYLLQTKPRAHVTACEHLRRQGFEVFLPLIVNTTKTRGKFLNSKVPLFKGYLFMGTSINPIPWRSVNGTRGVSKAVTLDGVYRPISSHIVNGSKRCDANGVRRLYNIAAADRIVLNGPLCGVHLYSGAN